MSKRQHEEEDRPRNLFTFIVVDEDEPIELTLSKEMIERSEVLKITNKREFFLPIEGTALRHVFDKEYTTLEEVNTPHILSQIKFLKNFFKITSQ